ncbi:MAG: hypothetical protein AYL32_002130 [Candidatus Bathyarchaeota archaeon B26-2]|nr:MAG: hypothetical protein AYL32_002130 [Candidatus Bathyarchaeota archaeon B26-2]
MAGKSNLKKNVQGWLTRILQDPITKILIKNSHLTRAQIETLLIDILSENIAERKLVYEEKAKLRLLKEGVSRGAFNRTLKQARENVIKSIYTLILLGYLGILETSNLEPYMEIANKLRTYTEAYRTLIEGGVTETEHIRMINMLQKELEEGLRNLSKPKSLKRT